MSGYARGLVLAHQQCAGAASSGCIAAAAATVQQKYARPHRPPAVNVDHARRLAQFGDAARKNPLQTAEHAFLQVDAPALQAHQHSGTVW